MKLVYCQRCRNPVGKLAPGSKAEIKCHRCGTRTYFEVEEKIGRKMLAEIRDVIPHRRGLRLPTLR